MELVLTICKFQRGRGLWKFNCSLLKIKDYLITINNVIDKEKLYYALPVYHSMFVSKLDDSTINFTISDSTLEVLLLQIRGETIKYASNLKRQSCEKEQNLKNEIENMEKNFEQIDQYKLDAKKKELESFRNEKIKGVMIRSRAQWLNDGEKPSKFLSSLEKHYYTEKTVRKIVTESGTVLTSQKEILAEIKSFYANLFENKDHDLCNYNLSKISSLLGSNTLTEKESKNLERILTLDEISVALKTMKNQQEESARSRALCQLTEYF